MKDKDRKNIEANEKEVYNIISNIKEIDKLDFNFEELGKEEPLTEEDIEKIKEKTYKRIGKENIKKYKYKRVSTLVACLAVTIFLGSTIVMAIASQGHKYEPSSGKIIQSETPIYMLPTSQTKETNDGEITLKSFIVNPEEKNIRGEIEGINVDYKYIKDEIKVNGKDILNNEFEEKEDIEGLGNDWSRYVCGEYEYQEGDQYIYSVILKDKEGNTTTIDFEAKLVEAKSIEEYNEYLPKDTQNNVEVSALTKNEDDTLYVDLMAISNQEDLKFEVTSFGNYSVVNNKTNIFLTDANGKEVEAQPEYEDSASNKFKFDIENLQKPFTIKVNEVNVFYNELETKTIKLPKIAVNEHSAKEILVDVEDKNNALTKESSEVLIKYIKRLKNEEGDSYKIIVDYPENENASIKLRSLNLQPVISPFSMLKQMIGNMTSGLFISSSQTLSEDGIYREHTLEYPTKHKRVGRAEFEIGGYEYLIEGPWEIVID